VNEQAIPFALALTATATFTAALALYTYGRRNERPGAGTFAALLTALTWYAAFAAFELLAPEIDGKVFAAKLKLAGLGAAGPLWLAFALRYTRRGHWLHWPNMALLLLPSLAGYLLALTNESHLQFWASLSLDENSPALVVETFGPAFWVFTGAQYAFILAAALIYAQSYTQTAHVYRTQAGLMAAGALVPLAANLIYVAGLYPVRGLDLTPFAFGISTVLLASSLFRFGLLDIQPVATRAIFEHLGDAVVVLDAEERVADLNQAARDLLGLDDDAIGLPAPSVLRQASAQAEARPGEPPPEVQLGVADVRRWFRIEFSTLRDDRGRPLGRAALLHDITDQRLLQQMRTDLINMLIHDLSNPLSAMQMALELLRGDSGPGPSVDAEAREAIEIIRRSNLRAQRLVASLLEISRLEGGHMPIEPQPVEGTLVAQFIVRDLRPLAAERQVELALDLAPGLPAVNADPDLLDRVLRNLLGNALKFTPAGGRVLLALQRLDDQVQFCVADNGPGLPAHVEARLFEKFVRGSGPHRGHGLGLAFCKLAVEAMGGHIWADNHPGQGVEFKFTLPLF
jgi:PAS domain S-box-containing protein